MFNSLVNASGLLRGRLRCSIAHGLVRDPPHSGVGVDRRVTRLRHRDRRRRCPPERSGRDTTKLCRQCDTTGRTTTIRRTVPTSLHGKGDPGSSKPSGTARQDQSGNAGQAGGHPGRGRAVAIAPDRRSLGTALGSPRRGSPDERSPAGDRQPAAMAARTSLRAQVDSRRQQADGRLWVSNAARWAVSHRGETVGPSP